MKKQICKLDIMAAGARHKCHGIVPRKKGRLTAIIPALACFFVMTVHGATEEMPVIRNFWNVSLQGPWVVLSDDKERGNEKVFIYNEYGDLKYKLDLAGIGRG